MKLVKCVVKCWNFHWEGKHHLVLQSLLWGKRHHPIQYTSNVEQPSRPWGYHHCLILQTDYSEAAHSTLGNWLDFQMEELVRSTADGEAAHSAADKLEFLWVE